MKGKTGVMLVAVILVGAGVLSFIAPVAYDAIGFGRGMAEQVACSSPVANQTFHLSYPAEALPSQVTYWTGAAGATFGGIVTDNATQDFTWDSGNNVRITSTGATWNGYPGTATFLMFNYTGQGSVAKSMTQPAIILVSIFAIVIVAGVMISGTGKLGGKSGGRKSFP